MHRDASLARSTCDALPSLQVVHAHTHHNMPPLPLQVSRFASEFMKRKLAEAAAAKSGKSRKAKAKAAATVAAVAAPTPAAASRPAAAGPPGYAPPEAAFPSLGAAAAKAQPAKKDADWEKASLGSC